MVGTMQNVKVGVFAMLLAAATAHAEDSSDSVQGAIIQQRIRTALAAIKQKQVGKATALLADVVTVEGLPFNGGTCRKSFGGEHRIEVTDAARAALVRCLGREKWFSAKLPFRVEKRGDAWTASVVLKPGYLPAEVPVLMKSDGSYVIEGIRAPNANAIQSDEPGDVPAPVAGGVVYVAPQAPKVRSGPLNVAPTLLERNRLSGDKSIVPDEPTKEAIEKSGREKAIGAFKLCVGTDGKVTSVTMLRSTRYPAYDARIAAEMKTWMYKPFEVDGTRTPVCTMMTFTFSQP